MGSGLELEIINKVNNRINVDAYDICITEFVSRFKNVFNVIEGEFKGSYSVYDHIIAIELLEHLEDPFKFLQLCYNSLRKEGVLATTTATNMPQFDHLYNFDDDNYFKGKVENIGYLISIKEDLPHSYMIKDLNAKNTWYLLKK